MSDHKTAAAAAAPDHHPPSQTAKPLPHSEDYAPYPKLDPKDVVPPPQPETWTSVSIASEPPPKLESPSAPPPPVADPPVHVEARAPIAGEAATSMPTESNPYVATPAPAPSSSVKSEYQ